MLQLYKSMVRPHLDYAVRAWSPHQKRELNHFKDNRNTILDLFSSLTSDNKMAREMKIQSF